MGGAWMRSPAWGTADGWVSWSAFRAAASGAIAVVNAQRRVQWTRAVQIARAGEKGRQALTEDQRLAEGG